MFSLYPHNTNTQDKVEDITYISSLDSQMAQKYRMNSGERKRERERKKSTKQVFPFNLTNIFFNDSLRAAFFFFFRKDFYLKTGYNGGGAT